MDKAAILIHPQDNVAVALRPLASGEKISVAGREVSVVEKIPSGHKIAVSVIASGGCVVKYGYKIGIATGAIAEGAWVHSLNRETGLGASPEYEFHPAPRSGPSEP